MNNSSSMEAKYVDPDPTSILVLSIWYVIIGIFGIPLNIFIIIATIKVQEIRAISANLFIGSLALSDALLMLSTVLHLPYALTFNETLCKIIGVGVTVFTLLGTCIPLFLALNRYAIVCLEQDMLARNMFVVFSKKGVYWIILLIWAFEIIYQLPFLILNTLGMHSIGLCTTVKKSTNNAFIRVYYYCGVFGVYALSYVPLFIFYRKISLWVKTMTAQLSLSVETKQTVRETENVLVLTKWVTVIPLIFSSPSALIAVLFEFNSEIVSPGVARLTLSLYPMIPLLNAIVTLKFARPYRLALKKVCDRATITSILFSWIIEGRWRNKVDVASENHQTVFASQS